MPSVHLGKKIYVGDVHFTGHYCSVFMELYFPLLISLFRRKIEAYHNFIRFSWKGVNKNASLRRINERIFHNTEHIYRSKSRRSFFNIHDGRNLKTTCWRPSSKSHPKLFSRWNTLTCIAPYGWNMSASLFRTASCCSGAGIGGRLPTCKSINELSLFPPRQESVGRAGWRSLVAPLVSTKNRQEGRPEESIAMVRGYPIRHKKTPMRQVNKNRKAKDESPIQLDE